MEPTGPYQADDWSEVIAIALNGQDETLQRLARSYQATRHPACLNAIMTNANGKIGCGIWLAYYRGKGDSHAIGH